MGDVPTFPQKNKHAITPKKVMQPVSALPFPLPFEFFSPRHAGEQKNIPSPYSNHCSSGSGSGSRARKKQTRTFCHIQPGHRKWKKGGERGGSGWNIQERGRGEKGRHTSSLLFSKINTCVPSSPSPSLFFPFMSPSLPFLLKKLRKKVPPPLNPPSHTFCGRYYCRRSKKRKKNSSAKRFDGCLRRKKNVFILFMWKQMLLISLLTMGSRLDD